MKKILSYLKFIFVGSSQELKDKSDKFVKIHFWVFWFIQLLAVFIPAIIILFTKETLTKDSRFTISGYIIILVLAIIVYSQIKTALKLMGNTKLSNLLTQTIKTLPFLLILVGIYLISKNALLVFQSFKLLVLLMACSNLVGVLTNWFRRELERREIIEESEGFFGIRTKELQDFLKGNRK